LLTGKHYKKSAFCYEPAVGGPGWGRRVMEQEIKGEYEFVKHISTIGQEFMRSWRPNKKRKHHHIDRIIMKTSFDNFFPLSPDDSTGGKSRKFKCALMVNPKKWLAADEPEHVNANFSFTP
jgi:hypothetical protein